MITKVFTLFISQLENQINNIAVRIQISLIIVGNDYESWGCKKSEISAAYLTINVCNCKL